MLSLATGSESLASLCITFSPLVQGLKNRSEGALMVYDPFSDITAASLVSASSQLCPIGPSLGEGLGVM